MLRTADHSDTKRLYATLTHELNALYCSLPAGHASPHGLLPSFATYQLSCQDGRKVTITDMWGRMLCSVPRTPRACLHCDGLLR